MKKYRLTEITRQDRVSFDAGCWPLAAGHRILDIWHWAIVAHPFQDISSSIEHQESRMQHQCIRDFRNKT